MNTDESTRPDSRPTDANNTTRIDGRGEVTESAERLVLEVKGQENETAEIGPFLMTPLIDESYWAYRVRVSDTQAIVGFPKLSTVGIGFAQEEDWNTNLPYTCSAEEIYEHIEENKGNEAISREDCLAAIRMIQEAVKADRAVAS